MASAELHNALKQQLADTAAFVPAAFHVHSPESHDWPKDGSDPQRNDKSQFLAEGGEHDFLDELAEHFGIVCITDHMKSSYACRLARTADASYQGLAVFPGMEVNCRLGQGMNERVHLLTIFPPDRTPSAIDRIFANSTIPLEGEDTRVGQEDFHSPVSLKEWVKAVEHEGGIVLAAHIDQTSRGHRAHFRVMRDASVQMFVTDHTSGDTISDQQQISEEYKTHVLDSGLHALEIMKPSDRKHYAHTTTYDGRTLHIPCVLRSDHHCIEGFADDSRMTYGKVSELTFDAVKQALRFFPTRIKYKSDILPDPTPRIVGLRLRSPSQNGLFGDATVAFNQNLNCLIGPRGCGKSTIIEAIRYILGRNADLADPENDHDDFRGIARSIQSANLSDTIVEMIYELDNGERHYLHATFDPKAEFSTQAYTLDGDHIPIAEDTIGQRYPARIYSWSEIEHLGRRPDLQRELLDRLINTLPDYQQEREEIRQELAANHSQLEAAAQKLTELRSADNGLLGRYSEFKSDFKRINKPKVARMFEQLDAARRRLSAVDTLLSHLNGTASAIEQLPKFDASAIRQDIISSSDSDLAEWWDQEITPRVQLSDLAQSVASNTEAISAKVREKIDAAQTLREELAAAVESRESELRSAIAASPEDELAAGKREQAKQRYDSAAARRKEYLQAYADFEAILDARKQLVTRLTDIQLKISGAKATSRNNLIDRLNEFNDTLAVSIDVSWGSDRDACIKYMEDSNFLTRDYFGQYRRSRFAQRCCAMASPTRIARAILDNDSSILEEEGLELDRSGALTTQEAQSLLDAFNPYSYDEGAQVTIIGKPRLASICTLQEQPWDDKVRILRDGNPVDQLSPGQRSSAMLPLVALSESAPLVIDQPEDNLDNRMVGGTLTRILADLKERRQIIVATHNPNIVVGGDAEQVVALDASQSREAEVAQWGDVDRPAVIETVIAIMEGGAEAFQARERRYQPILQQAAQPAPEPSPQTPVS